MLQSTYDWLNFSLDDSADENDVENFRVAGEAEKAVIRARYPVHKLDESENTGTFPTGLSESCPVTVRLDLRNHILRVWYTNPSIRLDVYTAVRDIPDKYHGLACAVYTQLVVAGAINYGAVPFTSPVAVKFSRDLTAKRRVAVIGAGFAGITVARQLRSFGISVTIIEARNRIGGRVHSTDKGGQFSTKVDLGGMLITGLIQSPIALLAQQTNAKLHILDAATPLFDVDGSAVPKKIDSWAETEYNSILDVTAAYRRARQTEANTQRISLGEAFKSAVSVLQRKRPRVDGNHTYTLFEETVGNGQSNGYHGNHNNNYINNSTNGLTDSDVEMTDYANGNSSANRYSRGIVDVGGMSVVAEKVPGINETVPGNGSQEDSELAQRLLRWHVANLEYACASDLNSVSLAHWDQDDPYGFIGDHALVKYGCKALVDALAQGLERNIRFETELLGVEYSTDENSNRGVRLTLREKKVVCTEHFDAVVCTIPLGVLKKGNIQFKPELPQYKKDAIQRLGCGGLMKVILEFPETFWIKKDMFGNLRESAETRGEFYIFWNMEPCCEKPILIGMVPEPAASILELMDDATIVSKAMTVLRRMYPGAPQPIASAVSRWGTDEYTHGVYTSITTESSGLDYDLLAKQVGNMFFAGEHTCRKYPTTCASAMISGLREARNVLEHFKLISNINAVHAKSLLDALQMEPVAERRRNYKENWIPNHRFTMLKQQSKEQQNGESANNLNSAS